MPSIPLHPAFVHLPLGLAVLVPLLGFALLFAVHRQLLPRAALAITAAVQVLVFVAGFAAMRTGEADEDRVEDIVGEATIERHEGAAKQFMGVAALAALLGVGALLLRKESTARAVSAAASVASVGALVMAFQVGKLGGEMVHGRGVSPPLAGRAQPAGDGKKPGLPARAAGHGSHGGSN